MYDLGCMLVESRPFVVLDGLPGLYGLKYDSATACGLLLYLCSYKLDGFATPFFLGMLVRHHLFSPVLPSSSSSLSVHDGYPTCNAD